MRFMTKEQLLDHYRNLYQSVKRDKDEIERELEEYKTLSSMQQDIISSLNKRTDILRNNYKILENDLNMVLSNVSGLRIGIDSNVTRINIH